MRVHATALHVEVVTIRRVTLRAPWTSAVVIGRGGASCADEMAQCSVDVPSAEGACRTRMRGDLVDGV